jgi:hypothetical protein
MTDRRLFVAVLGLATYVALLPGTAWAYVDPGSGSFVVQSILAALAGGAIFLRDLRQKLAQLLRRKPEKSGESGGRR